MSPKSIWQPVELRAAWEACVSRKAISIFELLIHAPNAEELKSTAQHASESGVPEKYVRRATVFLQEMGLLKVEG